MADKSEYGGISLSVNIDTSNIKSGVNNIVNQCSAKFKQLGQTIANAFKGGAQSGARALQKEYDEISNSIVETQRAIADMVAEQDKLKQTYGSVIAWGDIQSLPDKYIAPAKEYEELSQKISNAKASLDGLFEKQGDLNARIKELSAQTTKSENIFQRLGKGAGKAISGITKRLGTMLTRLLIIQTIYKVIRAVLSYFGKILKADDDIRKDWEEIKAALKVAIEPFVDVLVPVVKTLTEWIKDFAIALGQVSAMLVGKSYSELVEAAKATEQAADNYESMADSSGEVAKNAEKQLASFDDIQVLSSGEDKDDYSGYDRLASGEYDTEDVASKLSAIMKVAGGAMLAIGLILLSKGIVTPVTLGLIAGGAAVLLTGSLLGNENVVEALRGWIGVVTAIVSSALLVIGVILAFTGVALPLGLSLIAAGALGLVSVVAVNWNAIIDTVKNAINAVKDWVVTYGLLVIGIILMMTGAGAPFGVALILKWAKDNAGKVNLANKILSMVQTIWNSVKSFWNSYIAPVFTGQWWLNLGKNCINGLISGFEGGINGIIKAFENMINWIVDGLNKISFDIPDWLGGGTFGINLPRANLGSVSIPRLAQGGVIPANKEFLAILGDQKHGTNIETPLDTMVEAFNTALDSRSNETVKEERYFLGETELMQIIYKLAKKGERLQGTDLIV